jgi:steroid 5-alpha reductase family enzyme
VNRPGPEAACLFGSWLITAAIAVLDRGWGKPMQAVEATVSVFDQMTDDEQKMLLAALQALKGD